MALLARKRLLTAEIESTYGSDPAPVGSDAILVKNINVTPLQADVVPREIIRPFLGSFDSLLAQTRVEISFEVELAASGTLGDAPKWGAVMRSCGMQETVVAGTSVGYTPRSDGFESCTIYVYNDNVLHKLKGCRGSFAMSCEVGQIPTITFSLVGIYTDPSTVTPPSTTYTDQETPEIFKQGNTSGFSLFGYSGALQSISFDMANSTTYRELVGGTKEVVITDRAPAGNCVIEAPTTTQKNYFQAAIASATGSLAFQHGQTTGNIITFNSPQTDLGNPTYAETDGILNLDLPFISTPSGSGNDEISLLLT